jgi:D-lyxose ketol-isomerase
MAIPKQQYEEAKKRAIGYFEKANIALTEKEKQEIEVADFGLSELDNYGVELVMYVNTARVCAKEVILFPWQICPQHFHPALNGELGKEETFRCRWGQVYLYVDGPATKTPKARLPQGRKQYFTLWHEIILNPGDQYTVEAGKAHWFQGGPEGAVLSEFSTPSTDEIDVFTDPGVVRIPEIY